jgi:hypothetical protein
MSLFASPRLSSKKVPTLTGRCLAAHLRDLFAERLAFFHACFALILRFRRHEQKAIFEGKASRGTIITIIDGYVEEKRDFVIVVVVVVRARGAALW